jgi:hypothetical protein
LIPVEPRRSLPHSIVFKVDILFHKYKRFLNRVKSIITGNGSDSFKRMIADNAFLSNRFHQNNGGFSNNSHNFRSLILQNRRKVKFYDDNLTHRRIASFAPNFANERQHLNLVMQIL